MRIQHLAVHVQLAAEKMEDKKESINRKHTLANNHVDTHVERTCHKRWTQYREDTCCCPLFDTRKAIEHATDSTCGKGVGTSRVMDEAEG